MKKFPHHPAWADATTDKTGWWSQLRCHAEKAMKRSDGSDVLQTRPLYRHTKNSVDWYPIDQRDSTSEFPQDLHGIIGTLFEESTIFREYDNSTGPMQNRFKIITDYQAAGRGGEIKFLCWNETRWDPFLKTPQLIWREVKTLSQHRMYYYPDADDFHCDWMHAAASYALVESGLRRTSSQEPIKHFIFPSCHSVSDSQVTRQLTEVLRKPLDPNVKKAVTSRSLREGAGTEMAMHADVSDAEMRFRGGWTSADNSKHYMNESPAVLQAGGMCLAGHVNCHVRVFWPRLDSVLQHNGEKDNKLLYHLVNLIVPSNLPYFQQGMELWPLRQTMAASLLMYHFDVSSKYGPTNAVVAHVLDIAKLIHIQCPGVYDPVEVLKIWSRLIKDDYRAMNSREAGPNLKDTIRRQAEEISNLSRQLSSAVSQLNDLNNSFVHLNTMVLSLVKAGSGPKSVGLELAKVKEEGCTKNSEKDGIIDLVSSPEQRPSYSVLVPPSSLKKPPPPTSINIALKPTSSKQLKVQESSAKISIAAILKRFSRRHFSRYKEFSKVSFKALASVVCREFPGLRSSQMDVTRVLTCIDTVTTPSLISAYIQESDVEAISELIQERVIGWVIDLETNMQMRQQADGNKPVRVGGYVMGIAKRLMKIQKEYQKRTGFVVLPSPNELWEPKATSGDS